MSLRLLLSKDAQHTNIWSRIERALDLIFGATSAIQSRIALAIEGNSF
jgi:hypothetical protein